MSGPGSFVIGLGLWWIGFALYCVLSTAWKQRLRKVKPPIPTMTSEQMRMWETVFNEDPKFWNEVMDETNEILRRERKGEK